MFLPTFRFVIYSRILWHPYRLLTFLIIFQLPVKALLEQVLEAPGLQEWFGSAAETGNPDALLLAFKMREKVGFDHGVFGKLLPSEYSWSKLFSADYLSSVAICLKVTKVIFLLANFSVKVKSCIILWFLLCGA